MALWIALKILKGLWWAVRVVASELFAPPGTHPDDDY